jgi:hypothetical protein
MNATAVVIEAVRVKLALKIKRIPMECAIQILSAQGANFGLDRCVRQTTP